MNPNLSAVIDILAIALPTTGLILLILTVTPINRLLMIVPDASIRNKWRTLGRFIYLFIAAYSGYIIGIVSQPEKWFRPPIPLIMLFGSIYVYRTISLSLQTAAYLQRIDLLEKENVIDPLTHVYNRRYLDKCMSEEINRAKRYDSPLSILMIDIDNFKLINDTYGHQAGDMVLKTFGHQLKSASRDADIMARYGGEEFLMICTNTGIDDAAMAAERLRSLAQKHDIVIPDGTGGSKTIRISISIGVADLRKGFDSKEKLVQAADQALFLAKNSGRNRVVVAGSDNTELLGTKQNPEDMEST